MTSKIWNRRMEIFLQTLKDADLPENSVFVMDNRETIFTQQRINPKKREIDLSGWRGKEVLNLSASGFCTKSKVEEYVFDLFRSSIRLYKKIDLKRYLK